ncbi:hypothetical protein [Micromonospora sp. NPDC049645]|uniref:hypothetical protein n=1 Tax=Micromonospora sp. NPDC049645 TaxID=3155508 RepID=UPI00342FE23A
MAHTDPPDVGTPPEVLAAVAAIIGGAFEMLGHQKAEKRGQRDGLGWRRVPLRPSVPGERRTPATTAGGVHLAQALHLAAQHQRADQQTTRYAYAAVAMALAPHLGIAPHELLNDGQADEYLNPHTNDERLHQLDRIVLDRYNTDHAAGAADVRDLLNIAQTLVPAVVRAQLIAPELRALDAAGQGIDTNGGQVA